MNKRVLLRTVIAILSITIHSQASAQDVYKWVDNNGVVHYGQSVPAVAAGNSVRTTCLAD